MVGGCTLVWALAGCSASASSSETNDQAVVTGSRWTSPLRDGVYEDAAHGATLRLSTKGTSQLFTFHASESVTNENGDCCSVQTADCSGGVDVATFNHADISLGSTDDGACAFVVSVLSEPAGALHLAGSAHYYGAAVGGNIVSGMDLTLVPDSP